MSQGLLGNVKGESLVTQNIAMDAEPFFKISLAEWSLNKSIFGGKIEHLDFARVTRQEFGPSDLPTVMRKAFDLARK